MIPALDLGSTKVDAVLVDAELTGSVSAFELRIWIEERPPEVTMILVGSTGCAARAVGKLCDEVRICGGHMSLKSL